MADTLYMMEIVAWLVLLVLIVESLVSELRSARTKTLLVLGSTLLVSGVLRLAMATWGPGDDQMRFAGVLEPEFLMGGNLHADFLLGNAPTALYWLLSRVLGYSEFDSPMDLLVIAGNMVLGSLVVPFSVLLLRELKASVTVSCGAGAMLAIQPVLIRFSGDMTRVSLVVFLAVVGLWFLARYPRTGRAIDLVSFALAAWLCARSRPEAGLVIAVAGLMVALVQASKFKSLWDRPLFSSSFAVLVAGALSLAHLLFAMSQEPSMGEKLGGLMERKTDFGAFSVFWADADYTSPVVMLFAAFGVLGALFYRNRIGIWAALSLLVLTLFSPEARTDNLAVAYARYGGLPILVFTFLAASGLGDLVKTARKGRRARLEPWVLGVSAAFVLATSVVPISRVCAPRTVDLEYQFLRGVLPQLPEASLVYRPFKVKADFDGGFRNPGVVSKMLGHGEWHVWPPPEEPYDGPQFYYHAPVCYVSPQYLLQEYPGATHILKNCWDGLAAAGAFPEHVITIPAVHFSGEPYVADEMTIGFYRLPRQRAQSAP